MSWQHLLLIRLYDLLRRGKRSPNFPQQNWFIAFLFLMALGFFCLALFLYLSLDPDSGYTSASAAPSGKEGVEMRAYLKLGDSKGDEVPEDTIKAVADTLRTSSALKVSEDGEFFKRLV
ncbi:hypothetical protein F2Q68_00029724 [Brassica cretica]|uniref:Uncharacterized protein n=1 Tax=Brassica cretica TaxID=69181 RepID=A0A8S9G228_BRACR|nr:hypothetical protein F2Q68_00029724 [Brassica cretica]